MGGGGSRKSYALQTACFLHLGCFLVPEIGRSHSEPRARVQYESSRLGQLFMSKEKNQTTLLEKACIL